MAVLLPQGVALLRGYGASPEVRRLHGARLPGPPPPNPQPSYERSAVRVARRRDPPMPSILMCEGPVAQLPRRHVENLETVSVSHTLPPPTHDR